MGETENVVITIILGILIFTTIIVCSVYHNREARYENFQSTMVELSDEQKCLHICGFENYGGVYFDRYKFCVEKCDRISERECE